MAYCVHSLESPLWGDSNGNKQHTFMLKTIKRYPFYTSWPCAMINTHRSNYPCLEHIFTVLEVFETLKFFCTTLFMDKSSLCFSVFVFIYLPWSALWHMRWRILIPWRGNPRKQCLPRFLCLSIKIFHHVCCKAFRDCKTKLDNTKFCPRNKCWAKIETWLLVACYWFWNTNSLKL